MRFPEAVTKIQASRPKAPLWVTPDGLTPLGHRLVEVIRAIPTEGLDAESYHYQVLAPLTDTTVAPAFARHQIERAAVKIEQLFIDAYLGLAMDLAGSRNSTLDLPEKWVTTTSHAQVLAEACDLLILGHLDPDLGLDRFRPQHSDYAQLCQVLDQESARLARLTPSPVGPGSVLRLGDISHRVLKLRQQLFLWGDLAAPPVTIPGHASLISSSTFDASLDCAVRAFQTRHGLMRDGLVGTRTLLALDRSVDDHLAQIRLNLERLRWLPRDLGDRHLRVNIPDFTLSLYQGPERLFTSRAIVGKLERPTPVLSGKIRALVVNPYWNVPQKLAREDLLPKVLSNPSYLDEREFTVYENWNPGAPPLDLQTLDWSGIHPWDMAYKFQQRPGPQNPLGQVKFLFTNPFSVYLHDTNQREAFHQDQRTLSSGCVRIENPLDLAHLLMGNSSQDSSGPTTLESLLQSRKNQCLDLPSAIPVHLMYLTCWVDEAGSLNVREDVYGYDEKLRAALEAQPLKDSEEMMAAGPAQEQDRGNTLPGPTSFSPAPYPHE